MSKEFNIEALVEASDMEKKIADKVINAFKGMSKDEQAKFMKSYLKNPDAAVGYMFSNMQKMAMKEEKELDAVNTKALKGKFKDREIKISTTMVTQTHRTSIYTSAVLRFPKPLAR